MLENLALIHARWVKFTSSVGNWFALKHAKIKKNHKLCWELVRVETCEDKKMFPTTPPLGILTRHQVSIPYYLVLPGFLLPSLTVLLSLARKHRSELVL